MLPLPGRRDDHGPLGWRHCMLALGAEGAVDEGGELLGVSFALRSPIYIEDLDPVDELHLAEGTVGDDLNPVDELETAHATVDEGLELGHGSCAALAQILLTGGGRLCPKLIVDVTLGVRVDGGLTVGSNCLPGRAPIVHHEVPHAAGGALLAHAVDEHGGLAVVAAAFKAVGVVGAPNSHATGARLTNEPAVPVAAGHMVSP